MKLSRVPHPPFRLLVEQWLAKEKEDEPDHADLNSDYTDETFNLFSKKICLINLRWTTNLAFLLDIMLATFWTFLGPTLVAMGWG